MDSPILANTLIPWLEFTPGFSAYGYELAAPFTVLAAVVERPFVSRAGVSSSPLAKSIRANAITTLLGAGIAVLAPSLLLALLPVVWLLAVAISTFVEWAYYSATAGVEEVRAGPIAWGNIASAVVILAIPFMVVEIQGAFPQARRAFEPIAPGLRMATVAASGLVIVGAFVLPALRRARIAGPIASSPGGAKAAATGS